MIFLSAEAARVLPRAVAECRRCLDQRGAVHLPELLSLVMIGSGRLLGAEGRHAALAGADCLPTGQDAERAALLLELLGLSADRLAVGRQPDDLALRDLAESCRDAAQSLLLASDHPTGTPWPC